jgi:DNA repair protein RadC
MRCQRAELPLKLDGHDAARRFFAGCFAEAGSTCESLWVAHLDRDARCLHLASYQGDETGAEFPLRAIVCDAAEHGTAGILLAHNHPSGDPRPSGADRQATRRLAIAAGALDCAVLDHLVFAGKKCESFRQLGLL